MGLNPLNYNRLASLNPLLFFYIRCIKNEEVYSKLFLYKP